ncbi:MAG: SPOR domain-containing protein [Azoarcus sp.]|jgi:cell division septation protein DedD|nr:SPOR domain-containing protein [Azoarcus sp.]
MTTLRFFAILLVLLNVLVFAAAHGWFGIDRQSDVTEPERLDRQLYPERIKILGRTAPPDAEPAIIQIAPPAPSSSPRAQASGSRTCVVWRGLDKAQIDRLLALLASAGLDANTRDVETPVLWNVRIPPLASREAARNLERSLRAMGITGKDIFVQESSPNQYAISLGLFKTKQNATRHLGTLRGMGVKNVGIEERTVTESRVEVTASAEELDAALAGQTFARRYGSCQS